MPEVDRALQSLIDAPPCPPAPMAELERRVRLRRRRRRTVVSAGTVSATLLVVAVGLAAVTGGGQAGTTVRAGRAAPPPLLGRPVTGPRVQVQLPTGWQTLYAEGDRLVVGTRPLEERDLVLAVLARDDVVFRAFPPDGVVVVLGGDRMKAKYGEAPSTLDRDAGTGADRLTADLQAPGPALGLGQAKVLPGGVSVRLGDVPQSTTTIAAYAGEAAPEATTQHAEAVAASVQITPPERTDTPPPAPGSRPGFGRGEVPSRPEQLRPVAAVAVPGVTYTVRAEKDCAVVMATESQSPPAGGCGRRPPARGGPAVVALAADRFPPAGQEPGAKRWPETFLVLLRIGTHTAQVTAELVDGRVVAATVGSDGWALMATDGRPFLVEVRDRQGEVVARTPVI